MAEQTGFICIYLFMLFVSAFANKTAARTAASRISVCLIVAVRTCFINEPLKSAWKAPNIAHPFFTTLQFISGNSRFSEFSRKFIIPLSFTRNSNPVILAVILDLIGFAAPILYVYICCVNKVYVVAFFTLRLCPLLILHGTMNIFNDCNTLNNAIV